MIANRRLPPGQHAAELARFGLPQFARREVHPPARPVLIVTGDVRHPTLFDVRELMGSLRRREQRSDVHCVTTWSALDLAWSGASLQDVVRLVADVVRPHPAAAWLTATGLDGFSSCLALADALHDGVLLADRLHGAELTPDHGAPLRLVAPRHYAYKSVKHLTMLEYRRSYAPGAAGWKEHRRGRVMLEERSRLLPGAVWRRLWAAALPAVQRRYSNATTST